MKIEKKLRNQALIFMAVIFAAASFSIVGFVKMLRLVSQNAEKQNQPRVFWDGGHKFIAQSQKVNAPFIHHPDCPCQKGK